MDDDRVGQTQYGRIWYETRLASDEETRLQSGLYKSSGGSPATFSTTSQTKAQTDNPPIVPSSENGDGKKTQVTNNLDRYGNVFAFRDVRGTEAQLVTHVPTRGNWLRIDDSGGSRILTTFEIDHQGRVIEALGPVHDAIDNDNLTALTQVRTASWFIFNDLAGEVWAVRGYQSAGTSRAVNPMVVQKLDRMGRPMEVIAVARPEGAGRPRKNEPLPQSSWVRWQRSYFDDHGRHILSRQYHLIPSSGSDHSAYYAHDSRFCYDAMYRQTHVVTPEGTVFRTVFNAVGLPTESYLSQIVDDTAYSPDFVRPPEEILVSKIEYDNDGGGSGNATKITRMIDSNNAWTTVNEYDWRNRLTGTRVEGDGDAKQTRTEFGHDDQGNVTSISDPLSSVLQVRKFDIRGRLYRTEETAYLARGKKRTSVANTYYDTAGNIVRQDQDGGSFFTKKEYDKMGRCTKSSIGYHLQPHGEIVDARRVTAKDIIVQQTEMAYDPASNSISTIVRERSPAADLSNAAGPLQTENINPYARVSFQSVWHDALGRPAVLADFGTNIPPNFTRPHSIPVRSKDVLINSHFHNSSGDIAITVDPVGRLTTSQFDHAGRKVVHIDDAADVNSHLQVSTVVRAFLATIQAEAIGQAYVTHLNNLKSRFGVDVKRTPVNKTTYLQYNGDGNIVRSDVQNSGSSLQVTQYLYGPQAGGETRASILLGGIIDPQQRKSIKGYNRQGLLKTTRDPNGTIHEYSYDHHARLVSDQVTVPPKSKVDMAVQCISYVYDTRGRLTDVDTFARPFGATRPSEGQIRSVSGVSRQYDRWGNPVRERVVQGTLSSFFVTAYQYFYGEEYSHPRLVYIIYEVDPISCTSNRVVSVKVLSVGSSAFASPAGEAKNRPAYAVRLARVVVAVPRHSCADAQRGMLFTRRDPDFVRRTPYTSAGVR
ncbi:MAG: hypothetical protein K8T91_14155 [Planctomycetes bacterium]|nr:hypothetical protein [Planctomycetota bacterium]